MQGPLEKKSCQNALGKEFWNKLRECCVESVGEERCSTVFVKNVVEQCWGKSGVEQRWGRVVSRRVGKERLREVLGKSRSSVGEASMDRSVREERCRAVLGKRCVEQRWGRVCGSSAGEERCREVLGSVGEECREVLNLVCCLVICCYRPRFCTV